MAPLLLGSFDSVLKFMSRIPPLAEQVSPSVGSKDQLPRQKRPNFFIVGAPKCGTTSLDYYLSQHPDIFVARKEMQFFGSDLCFGRQYYRRDQEAYLAEFSNWSDQICAGECSVWYLLSRLAAAEIKAFNPESRIIVMLRDPVAMLESLYHQFRADGNEYLPTFEEALAAEPDRRAGRRFSRQTYLRQALDYRAAARWTDQVQRYFDVFGRERVHVVVYDDLVADTAGVYRKALEFLGVPSRPIDVDFSTMNGNHTVKSTAFRAFLQDPLVRGTAIALRKRVPAPVFNLIRNVGLRLSEFNGKEAKRKPISSELQFQLRREFAPEVERLSALLGRDLTHWSKPALIHAKA
jgi:hypothetical protein